MAEKYSGEVVVSSAPKEYTGDVVAPKAPVSQAPDWKEKAGAYAYGLGTSTLGSLGELEKFLNPDEKKHEKFLGRETIFPTVEEAEKGYEMIGIRKPRAAVKGYQTAGELTPAVVGGGKLAIDLGKAGVKKIGSLISGGKDLAAELQATTAGKTAEEIAAAEKRAKTAEKRAGVAEKITEREAGKGEAAYGKLPGVTTATEAGVTKGIPESEASIGQRIKTKTKEIYDNLKAVRQANAEKNKADAFNYARSKELAGDRVEKTKAYKDVENQIDRLLNDKETGTAVATLDAIKNPLLAIRRAIDPRYVDEATGMVRGKPVSFEGLEQLRRFLRDRSYGLPAEGFDAINQQMAGDLAKSIEKVMSEFSGKKIDKFINQYRKDSEPLQAFQSRLGKSFVGEQKGTSIATTPAESVANAVFKNKENYDNFISAIGGDEKLAKEEAQRYFAGQLEGKTAAQARKFLADNRTMLKETGSYEMAGKYVQQLEQAEKRGAGAKTRGAERTKTAAEQRKRQGELQIIQSDIDRADKITNPKEKITYINKQAEKLADYLPIEQRDQFLTEVQSVVNAEQKKLAVKKWTGIALGAAGLYTTGHVASGLIGK